MKNFSEIRVFLFIIYLAPLRMEIHHDIQHLPKFKNAAITVGAFDGVHTGHLQIINQLKKEAERNGGESIIITFHPHPRMVIHAKIPGPKNPTPLQLINTLEEKIELLKKQKVDHLVIVPFTEKFSNLSAEEYLSEFLIKNFQPKTIITGYDHHFGKDRKGDYKLLESFQETFHYTVAEIPAEVLDNITISSTKIRHAIMAGDMATANEYLGYDYFFTGKIIDGNKLGRTLGYPTANIHVDDLHKLIPAYGIYAVEVDLGRLTDNEQEPFVIESSHQGMMSIGIRPTIGDNKVMTEVNIFDFDQEIYGRNMRVHVKEFLREEIKFDNLEELKSQINKDEIAIRRILKIS
ncbi:MAG: bifunctional riboflavin kinase/FAD synthetase [Ginsengibacter sp.]